MYFLPWHLVPFYPLASFVTTAAQQRSRHPQQPSLATDTPSSLASATSIPNYGTSTPPPLPSPPCHTANSTIGRPTAAARVRFYHAAMFSPSLSTLQKAIDAGYLQSIPGLDSESLRRHPPVSAATIKGHLNAQCNNVRSTKRTYTTPHFIYNASMPPPRNDPTLSTPTAYQQQAESTPINPALSSHHPSATTNTSSSSTTMTATSSMPSPFLPEPRNN